MVDPRMNCAPSDFDPTKDLPKGFFDFLLPLHRDFTPRQQALVAKRARALEDLCVDLRAAEMPGQALGEVKRARPAGIVRQEIIELALELRVGLGLAVGLLQIEDQRHQRLGDKASAIDTEMAALVGAGAIGVGRVGHFDPVGRRT